MLLNNNNSFRMDPLIITFKYFFFKEIFKTIIICTKFVQILSFSHYHIHISDLYTFFSVCVCNVTKKNWSGIPMRYYPVSKCPTPCYGTSQAEESFSARQDRYKGSLCVTKKFRERETEIMTRPGYATWLFNQLLSMWHTRAPVYILLFYISFEKVKK